MGTSHTVENTDGGDLMLFNETYCIYKDEERLLHQTNESSTRKSCTVQPFILKHDRCFYTVKVIFLDIFYLFCIASPVGAIDIEDTKNVHQVKLRCKQ